MKALFIFFLLVFSLQTVMASDTRTCVTDDSARLVCLPKPAERIISLSPAVTELLYSAGAGNKVIAVDDYSDFPVEVKNLPVVGGYNSMNPELILAFNPDLIVLWEIAVPQAIIERLESLDIPLFFANPTVVPAIAETVIKLGKLTQTEQTANKAATAFLEDYRLIAKQNQAKKQVQTYFDLAQSPMMTVNGYHIISVAIETCGGKNIFHEAIPPLPLTSRESLVARNPEAIIYAAGLNDLSPDFWLPLATITAVKNKALIPVDPDILVRPTFRLLEGIKTICSALDQVRKTSSTKTVPTS